MCADHLKPPFFDEQAIDIAGKSVDLDGELADLAYETAISPARYDDLMTMWDSHIRRLLHTNGAEPQTIELDADLTRHFSRALEVFDRLGRNKTTAKKAQGVRELVNSQPGCALAFDARGDLVASNAAAQRLLGLSDTPTISELPIDGTTRASLRDALSNVRNDGVPKPLVVRDVRDRPLVLMTSSAEGSGVVLANAAEGHWSATTDKLLTHGFGITTRELALLRGLYDGLTLRQIAEQRSRSIGTVRTQLKAVQQKTGAHSQVELMRLIIGLIFASNKDQPQKLDSQQSAKRPDTKAWAFASTLNKSQSKEVTLKDGRTLVFDDLGPTDGTETVIFLHGMLDYPRLPVPVADLLRESKTRCFCLHRPGYGRSSAFSSDRHLGELLAADIEEFMDVLNLEQVSLIGHLSGGVFACIAAAMLGSRIKAVVNVNAGVPILSRQQFEVMMPRQRVIALTAKYAPKALPLMLRAGIALLDSGGERDFMRSLHRHSPRDHRLAQRPDVFAQIAEGYRFAVAQGHETFQRESVLVTSNWESYVDAIECPVTYINGAHDGVVSIGSVREFVKRHPEIRLQERAEYGQLMLHGHPEDIGKSLIEVLRGATPNRRRSAS